MSDIPVKQFQSLFSSVPSGDGAKGRKRHLEEETARDTINAGVEHLYHEEDLTMFEISIRVCEWLGVEERQWLKILSPRNRWILYEEALDKRFLG